MKLALLRALKHRVREAEAEITIGFLANLDTGDAKAATLPDGTRLGKVSKVNGKSTFSVTGEAAFLGWVENTYPTEIMAAVRPAFREKLLTAAKVHGMAVDPKTGELIPGITLSAGNPYIAFRSEPGFHELIEAHWNDLVGIARLIGGE